MIHSPKKEMSVTFFLIQTCINYYDCVSVSLGLGRTLNCYIINIHCIIFKVFLKRKEKLSLKIHAAEDKYNVKQLCLPV